MTQASLFPEDMQTRVRRVDDQILRLLMGERGGPFSLPLRDEEKMVLEHIRYRRGLANAVNLGDIQRHTQLSARTIKLAVRTLRMTFRLPIGSSKHATEGGYYIIVDSADRAAWAKDVTDQVRAEVEVLRAALDDKAGLELLGQLQLEIEAEASHA
jgi:hypothetical protein